MPAVGLEPTNSNESGFTIRRNCRYAILAFLSFLLDSNQRPSACKADALPTELRKDVVTPSGLEPETPSLKVRCSKPIELRGHLFDKDNQDSVNIQRIFPVINLLAPTLPDQLTVMGCFGLHPQWF